MAYFAGKVLVALLLVAAGMCGGGGPLSSGSARGRRGRGHIYVEDVVGTWADRGCMRLRGGKRIDKSKIDKKEYEFAKSAKLSPELEKDLRRHWKKKPKEILISDGKVSKKVRAVTLIQLTRDRLKAAQKHKESLPMRLLALGSLGLRWVRDVPGMWSNWRTAPTKWDALQPPPRRISAEEVKAIELLEVLFAGENGYDIARILKPRMTSQPLQMITEPGDYKKTLTAGAKEGSGMEIVKPVERQMTNKEVQAMGKLVVKGEDAAMMPHVGSHTYGEIGVKGFAEVLFHVAPTEKDVFVDLGSGTGKAVMMAAALYPVKKSYGVEYVEELHEAALRLQARFRDQVAGKLPLYEGGKRPLPDTSLSLADMKDSDWADATIVFAASTCWSKDLMSTLSKGCERLPVGARVVTMTQKPELDSKKWSLVKKTREWYGKGKLTWWVYRRDV